MLVEKIENLIENKRYEIDTLNDLLKDENISQRVRSEIEKEKILLQQFIEELDDILKDYREVGFDIDR